MTPRFQVANLTAAKGLYSAGGSTWSPQRGMATCDGTLTIGPTVVKGVSSVPLPNRLVEGDSGAHGSVQGGELTMHGNRDSGSVTFYGEAKDV